MGGGGGKGCCGNCCSTAAAAMAGEDDDGGWCCFGDGVEWLEEKESSAGDFSVLSMDWAREASQRQGEALQPKRCLAGRELVN